jgi:hypothetical protein
MHFHQGCCHRRAHATVDVASAGGSQAQVPRRRRRPGAPRGSRGRWYADTTPWMSLRKKQRKVGTPLTPTQRRRLHQAGVDYTAALREHAAAPWPLFSLPELCTFAPPYEFVSSSPFCEPGFDPCLVQEPKPPFFLQTLSACVGQPSSRACA